MLFLVLDVETGGVESETDALLSIAAVACVRKIDGNIEELDEMSVIINPPKNLLIKEQALAKNKLNVATLRANGLSEVEALSQLLKLGSRHRNGKSFPLIVGWNIHFDLAFLQKAFKRNDLGWPFPQFNSFDVSMYWKHYNLWQLGQVGFRGIEAASRELLGTTIEHEAMSDVKVTIRLLQKFIGSTDGV